MLNRQVAHVRRHTNKGVFTMSVQAMLAVADQIAKGQRVKMPAMKFSDWPLFCRCLQESRQNNK